jgi:hypothetical protein
MGTYMKAITGIFVAAMILGSGAWGQHDDLTWHTEYASALQEARDTGKPLLVGFRCIP